MLNAGAGTTGPGNGFGLISTGTEQLNSSTMPWIKNVDLRLTRGFRIGGARDLTLFADFRNLFNWTNLTAIFAETAKIAMQAAGGMDYLVTVAGKSWWVPEEGSTRLAVQISDPEEYWGAIESKLLDLIAKEGGGRTAHRG